jgi:hypothetical protein
MRRVGAWGMAAALVVGLGVAVASGQEPDGDLKPTTAKGGWWYGEKPKSKGKADKKAKGPAEDKPAPPSAAEVAVLEQERQMNAFSRRVEVCLRLHQIGLDTGNEELQRQAEELEARAWEVYRKQTAHLPIPALPPESEAGKSNTGETVGRGGLEDEQSGGMLPVTEPMTGMGDSREFSGMREPMVGRDKP